MRVDKRTVMESILGLAERPEWTERNMDPERAKIDLVLLAARGDVVTVAGMARRWGMPRTSARRVIQTATALVPWLGTYLDSPKKDPVTSYEAANLDAMVDMGVDSLQDIRNQGAAEAQAKLADTVADSLMDSPQNSQSVDHEAEGLVMKLDTMTEPESGAAIFIESPLFDDVQEGEPMDIILDMDTDSQNQDGAKLPVMLEYTEADMNMDSPLYTFLDLSDPGVDPEDHAELDQVRTDAVAVTGVARGVADDEARAREMALEAWDGADARTFQTCDGEFEQFWTYRKRHFLELAAQELTSETL